MKILYISKSIIPSRTANSIHVMKMCQALADIGHDVILLAPNIKDQYEKIKNNIYDYYGVKKNFKIKKIWHPNLKIGAFLYTISIFFYLLFNKKFDLIYGRFLHGCYVSILLKNKVIFESHNPIVNNKNHKLMIFKRLIKSKYFEKLVVISQALKNIYLENGYLNDMKIQVAHDGADEVKEFNRKAKLLGCKDNLKVGYVGHMYKGKGMEVISSIAEKLEDDVDLHIVGGLENDIAKWKNKIVSKNVYFYGFISHKNVSNYINAFDICLLPNQKIVHAYSSGAINFNENISTFTSPLKLFEYMSHKKAIIASDLPVIREILNEKNSILVESNNIDLWIGAIKKLKNIKNRKLIANEALNDFFKYTWKNRASLVV
jgi:glycosyltransferase involved in cell wall biosynthesis